MPFDLLYAFSDQEVGEQVQYLSVFTSLRSFAWATSNNQIL